MLDSPCTHFPRIKAADNHHRPQKARKDVVSDYLPAGSHAFAWNAVDNAGRMVSGGKYFSRLSFGEVQLTQKMLLLKQHPLAAETCTMKNPAVFLWKAAGFILSEFSPSPGARDGTTVIEHQTVFKLVYSEPFRMVCFRCAGQALLSVRPVESLSVRLWSPS